MTQNYKTRILFVNNAGNFLFVEYIQSVFLAWCIKKQARGAACDARHITLQTQPTHKGRPECK
jgi:hypothetical protein